MTPRLCGIINLTGHDTDGLLGEIGKMVTWQRNRRTMVIIMGYDQNPGNDAKGIIIIITTTAKMMFRQVRITVIMFIVLSLQQYLLLNSLQPIQ